jgi:flagellar motor switch protein FliG
MKTTQKLYIFRLLLEWLLTLVYYRCSAIYIRSNCVDHLIFESHLLLAALLGHNGNTILSSLTESEINDVINKMFYIEGFMLSMAIPTKNYLSIEVIINTLRKLLTSANQQQIIMYLPSYLYAKIIGYVKTPYTTEIIYRLIVFFLNQNKPQK